MTTPPLPATIPLPPDLPPEYQDFQQHLQSLCNALTPRQQRFLAQFATTHDQSDSLKLTGVAYDTLAVWRSTNLYFKAAMEEVKALPAFQRELARTILQSHAPLAAERMVELAIKKHHTTTRDAQIAHESRRTILEAAGIIGKGKEGLQVNVNDESVTAVGIRLWRERNKLPSAKVEPASGDKPAVDGIVVPPSVKDAPEPA